MKEENQTFNQDNVFGTQNPVASNSGEGTASVPPVSPVQPVTPVVYPEPQEIVHDVQNVPQVQPMPNNVMETPYVQPIVTPVAPPEPIGETIINPVFENNIQMPFNGVNAETIVPDPQIVQESQVDAMKPEVKKDDNSGLKFLLVLGIIILIFIILLPYIA